MEDFKNSKEILGSILDKHPNWPHTNYEMALVLLETGEETMARELLQRADEIWEEADGDFEPAQLVREKLAVISN
jgi:hypothetical protein